MGKFLREHHLDELPQLWNVFIGDMAFIGPRPERRFYIDQIMSRDGCLRLSLPDPSRCDFLRHSLQRLYRYLGEDAEPFEYDLYYLEHRSWGLDMKILWLTFYKIVSGKKF